MPESIGDLTTLVLGLAFLWFLLGSLSAGEGRGRRRESSTRIKGGA